ncbi:MAG: cell surface protein SprA, partial [Phycisphaerae bacterium]|nr:cell surface protein SprA [Saprospiraceae bacterium]
MTKKNNLLAAIALFSVCALYAFAYPEAVRENVLTLFFPDGERPVASVDHSPLTVDHLPLTIDRQKSTVNSQQSTVNSQQSTVDTVPPLNERYDDFINAGGNNPVDLHDPKAIDKQVEYDAVTNRYIVTERIGDDFYRAPTYMTFEEYVRWRDEQQQREYFDRLQGVVSADGKSADGTNDPVSKFNFKNSLIDRLFGGTNVDIKPQGNINLTFGYDWQKIQNPILTLRQQTNGNFDFDMDINMSAQGKIGEKLNLNFNYNTQATFDFDNQMKINYDTKGFSEDEIIQNVEAGNVSMPLRSNLIKGAQNLFGIKTEMKFGHLRTTLVASQQRSKQQSLKIQGGSQVQTFEKPIDEYDENRHFFVSHWNRDHFEPAMKCLPVLQSLFNVTRMEVWITNDKQEFQNTRDVVPLTDLGEALPSKMVDSSWALLNPPAKDINGSPLPANQNNRLYSTILSELANDPEMRFSDRVVSKLTGPAFQTPGNMFKGLKQIKDFEKMNARLLSSQEYTFNEQLGFISINLNVQPDQVVGVALSYTYNGVPYKIGEFSDEVPKKSSEDTLKTNVLFLKMLKSTTANVKYPIWDLMMKNIYAVGTANVDPQEFRFDVYYEDPGFGQKRFLDGPLIPNGLKSRPLLQVFNLDNLNLQGDPGPDGIFDFVQGITINLRSGRIMFPVLEPFGSDLLEKIDTAEAGPLTQTQLAALNSSLIYQQLYDSTTFVAREYQHLNRFMLRGTYKSSVSSEISLGTFNLPPGSVRVSAGGTPLREGIDYSIDYNIGKVRILNDAILQSGQSVNVSFEDNTFFGFQSRSMIGARFDYAFSKDLSVGATFMNLFERPLTQKVNFGDDPINNKVYGLDFSISKDAPWLTKLIDKLPLISTKEPSSITAQAEVAVLQPGHNRAINQGGDKGGTVYLDDFEGSTANIPLTTQFNQWIIASVPQGDLALFPESDPSNTTLSLGANRAGLSWYISDPSARDQTDATDPYTRLIQYQDIFPNRQLTPFEQSSLRPLDVTIWPRERGPYNFEIPTGYATSKGLNDNGELNLPNTRWAGFMKELNTNDFEASNIEFIEFWMLNPYMDKTDGEGVSDAGQMYIDLGSISEDVMRDSRQFFENGLPTGTNNVSTDASPWGRVPIEAPIVNAFDNNEASRKEQDIGLDGLDNLQETSFGDIGTWYNLIQNTPTLSQNFKNAVTADPSNDNFVYFRDNSFPQAPQGPGLLNRYRRFNNQEGNSPVNQNEAGNQNPSSTNYPDQEDLNRDRSLNETEAYFRYKIDLKKRMGASQEEIDEADPAIAGYITNTVTFTKDSREYKWYRFKVPLDDTLRKSIGGIEDFRSVRFIRMFWKGFDERTTFRFATLELGRNQWRRFKQNLGCSDTPMPDPIPFDVNAVNIEENSARQPFNYTIPYGIQREQSVGAFPDILQNEQSLALNVCELPYCDARAVFKSLNMDLRQFKRLKMFAHGEETVEKLDTGDLKIFIRMGSDYTRNYYEYELPLLISNPTNLNGNPDSREYKEEVWRNNFDFPLELLTEVKKQRNADPNPNPFKPYIGFDPDNPDARVRIFGNPNLGYVKGIMIGVRNSDPDGMTKHCVEVWLNELRLNGFNEKGGFAGLARVDMKLADLGGISVAGNYTGIGWGSIEEKLAQRQREEVMQYDLSTNLELGKLLPEKSGLKIPFYAQYSNVTRTPEYDPYDLDIKLKDKLRETADAGVRDSIRAQAKDITVVKGYNFTNVRKERRGKARQIPLPWNIENFSVTYAYNEQEKRTPFILSDRQKQYKGGLDWQYGTGMKPITPFKKLIKKDKYLKFISEFNFNPLPNTYGFNTNLERFEGITTYRFAGENPELNTYYNRRFTWERNYDLGWDITKGIRFGFDANAKSLIDEPLEYES